MASPEAMMTFTTALVQTLETVQAKLRQQLRAAGLELTPEMLRVLHYLLVHEGVSQQQIARALQRNKASLTSLLDNLVRRGLVERHVGAQDRRTNSVLLTAQGRAVEQQTRPIVAKLYTTAGEQIAANQLKESSALLAQINSSLCRVLEATPSN